MKTMSMALDLQRLSNNQIWRGLWQRNVSRDNHPLNVCHKLQFSCEIAHYRKNSISVFQEIFASADKVLFFERRTEHEAIIQWSFKIFLIFRNYIRFQAFFFLVWALSPSIGENAVGLSFCKSFIKQGKKNYL